MAAPNPIAPTQAPVTLRSARPADAAAITTIDAGHTGEAKLEHWRALLADCRKRGGVSLVAEVGDRGVVGYLLGEVRAWEFGSPPAGWIYGVGVDPHCTQAGIGKRLLADARVRFAQLGVTSLRTMVRRDDVGLLRFFRGAGFVAGPFVEMEVEL